MNITTKCPQCKKTVVPNITHTPICMRVGCPDCKIIIIEFKNENDTQTKSEDSKKDGENKEGQDKEFSNVPDRGLGKEKRSN